MPSNRFDTSQEHPYVSNYIPLPFETIAALGEKANKNFAEGKQAEAELGALGQAIKAAPMYEDHRQKFINEYNQKTKRLVDEAKGDYGSKDFQTKAQQLINEFKSRPEINAFTNTLKSYQDWESQVKDPKNAMNLDFTYDKTSDGKSFRQRDVLNEGVYSPTFTQFEDYTKTAKDVMGKVADSGYDRRLGFDFSKGVKINNGETQVFDRTSNKWVGVSSDRVKGLSSLMVPEYAHTVAGKHHLQKVLGANVDYDNLPDNVKEAVNQEFANHLFRSNANQIGGIQSSDIDYMQVNDRRAAGDNDATNFGRIITTNEQGNPEATDMKSVLTGLDLGDVLDATGEFKTTGILDSKYVVTKPDGSKKEFTNSIDAHKFAGSTGVISQQKESSSKSADAIVNQGYQKLAEISNKLGLGIPKNGNYRKQVYDYAVNIAKQRSTTSNLQPNTSEQMTNFFLGENSNIHNMEVYAQGDELSNAKMTNEAVAALAKNSKITGLDYYGNNQAGWKIAVTPKDDKGNPTGVDQALIAIPRDKKFEEETRPVYTISKGALEFAKTGNIDQKYKDGSPFEKGSNITVHDKLQQYANNRIAGKPKIAASSSELAKDENGNILGTIIRGSFVQVVNGEPKLFGIEVRPGYPQPIVTTLDKIQNAKTEELQLNGSLNQYVNKLAETTKPSKVK